MTEKERAEIRRHVSDREKLAYAMAAERSRLLLAEFEKQIAASYSWADSEYGPRRVPRRCPRWTKPRRRSPPSASGLASQVSSGRACTCSGRVVERTR